MLYLPKICIVDDNEQYRNMVEQAILKKVVQTAKIQKFSSLESLVGKVDFFSFDLFIVDIRLKKPLGIPEDGRDIINYLPLECINTPFLFVSGYSVSEDIFKEKCCGYIYDFISKTDPFDLLINRIRILLKISSYCKQSNVNITNTFESIRKCWKELIIKDKLTISAFNHEADMKVKEFG